jgi:hypothetical protein
MASRKVDVPPLIYGSGPLTLIVIALSVHGNMTRRELSSVTTLHKTRVTRLLNQLKRRKLVLDFTWGGKTTLTGTLGRRRKNPTSERMWALDPHHPLFLRIGDLGRCLAKQFPTPNDRTIKQMRRYHGPRLAKYQITGDEWKIFGDAPIARTLLLLSWAHNVPIEKMTTLLGRGRGTRVSISILERYGIVTTRWHGSEHQVSLNPDFCAYYSLRGTGRVIDKATGAEHKYLAQARQKALLRKRALQHNKSWQARRKRREREQAKSSGSLPLQTEGTKRRKPL